MSTGTPEAICGACYTKINEDDAFCGNCGYPIKGSEMEQQTFILQRSYAEADLGEIKKKLKRAGNSLFYLAAVFAFWGILAFFMHSNDETMTAEVIANFILAAIYVVLGEYSKKKPLACLICGLALYAIVFLLNAIADPVTIAKGIIVKILIVGYLIHGIKATMEAEKLKKEYNLS